MSRITKIILLIILLILLIILVILAIILVAYHPCFSPKSSRIIPWSTPLLIRRFLPGPHHPIRGAFAGSNAFVLQDLCSLFGANFRSFVREKCVRFWDCSTFELRHLASTYVAGAASRPHRIAKASRRKSPSIPAPWSLYWRLLVNWPGNLP